MGFEVHGLARKLWSRALAQGKLAHAYLLVGPEGAGKRTLAREFAASLVCAGGFPPCLSCSACERVMKGIHPDVMEAAAETRSILIGQVRELSDRLQYHAFEGGFKVGIIPQAETMTEEAQNAFLKTLEEPPPDTVLLLTAVNLSRLLPTIISRCQVLRLGPLPEEVIRELVQKERGLPEEAARLMAALAQGNARRALDLEAEPLLKLRREMVQAVLALDSGQPASILNFAQNLAKLEYPPELLLDLLAGFYWDAMDEKLGRPRLRNQDLKPEISLEAEKNNLLRLLQKLTVIHEARLRITGNANPRMVWEILASSLAVGGRNLLPAG